MSTAVARHARSATVTAAATADIAERVTGSIWETGLLPAEVKFSAKSDSTGFTVFKHDSLEGSVRQL